MGIKPLLVGITGGSASGKTLFIKRLLESMPAGSTTLLSQDNYYKTKDQQPKDHQGIENFDTPMSIDFDKFSADLDKLQRGEDLYLKEYTFNNPESEAKALHIPSAPIIVAEGIFVFYDPALTAKYDLRLFIDAKEVTKIRRRIVRDQQERGYDIDDVLYRYEYHVTPTYERYIEPFKSAADLVIPNNTHFQTALDVVLAHLNQQLALRQA